MKKFPIEDLGFSYIPDIFLEKGCAALNIQGPTIFDIKNHLYLDTGIKQSNIYKQLKDTGLVNNVIVLYINSTRGIDVDNVGILGRVKFWAANEFLTAAKEAIKEGTGDLNAAIRRGLQKESREWRDIRQNRLETAKNDLSRFDCVLFLGAGVSVSANLPKWNELLKCLVGDDGIIKSNDYDEIYREMDYSNLVVARYINKSNKRDQGQIVDSVRQLLYSNKSARSSELIDVICKLVGCAKNIQSIVTYNYDTLIEENLNAVGIKNYSVYKDSRNEFKSLPIYHVHGIIHREKSAQPEEIILSEENYHRVYTEVFDWSNVEQLHALTRCTCFFIGLSLKDPNLRRLLEVSAKDREKSVRHYAFLERKSFCKDVKKSELDFQTREDILADLGLNVIWYNGEQNHKELPQLLSMLFDNQS